LCTVGGGRCARTRGRRSFDWQVPYQITSRARVPNRVIDAHTTACKAEKSTTNQGLEAHYNYPKITTPKSDAA
jgi:hypothetical protein